MSRNKLCETCNNYYDTSGYYEHLPHCEAAKIQTTSDTFKIEPDDTSDWQTVRDALELLEKFVHNQILSYGDTSVIPLQEAAYQVLAIATRNAKGE